MHCPSMSTVNPVLQANEQDPAAHEAVPLGAVRQTLPEDPQLLT